MLKEIVSLLRGTVRARAESRFPERVLNVCSARGIAFRDPAFLGENEIALSVDRRDWRRLKAACADVDARVHIERASGVPFVLGRLRRRAALLAGTVLCAVLLVVNACFIWDLQVEGNETVPAEEILRVLARNGVRRGTFAFSVNARRLCNRALLDLPELSWLTVNVRGCRAHVIVRERIPRPEIVNESAPTNVVAARDALVTEVRALDGEARVQKGATVRKGQLLISGVVETKDVNAPRVASRFLAGKGEVYGRTWYELSAKIPLYEERKAPAGEGKRYYSVLWGENRVKFRINGYGNLSTGYDKIIERKQWTLPGGFALPLTWMTETYLPYETARKARTREEAMEIGTALLEARLAEQVGPDGEIVSVRTASAARGDWLLVTLSAECLEQIGQTVPIPME